MAIQIPGHRYGKRLQKSKVFGHGALHSKGALNADLLITPLVDMFVIIVLFLIANFSATGDVINLRKDIQLPKASNTEEIKMAPTVMMSGNEIMLDGALVAKTADVQADTDAVIDALEVQLREAKSRYMRTYESAPGKSFEGDINIQGDAKVPHKVFRRVIATCAQVGYGSINLAAMSVGKTTE